MSDLISRQAAIDSILEALHDLYEYDLVYAKTVIVEELERVPSVQTVQKTGQWIPNKHTDTVLCGQCGKCYGDEHRYCPHCGAKMEE